MWIHSRRYIINDIKINFFVFSCTTVILGILKFLNGIERKRMKNGDEIIRIYIYVDILPSEEIKNL